MFVEKVLLAKLSEVEQLSADIKRMERDSGEQKGAIYRWAVVGDEVRRLMLQAEEQLAMGQLMVLKAKVNRELDLWTKYRDGEWRLPKFGGPGPGDPPPPTMSLGDFLR